MLVYLESDLFASPAQTLVNTVNTEDHRGDDPALGPALLPQRDRDGGPRRGEPGALHNNPRAHDYARLYFRPRNAFHLKTEGVKCIGDPYRDRHQMSVPVLLAFDAVSVLTRDGVGFSQGKLSRIREIGNDERFFDRIPFERVFHDGQPSPRISGPARQSRPRAGTPRRPAPAGSDPCASCGSLPIA